MVASSLRLIFQSLRLLASLSPWYQVELRLLLQLARFAILTHHYVVHGSARVEQVSSTNRLERDKLSDENVGVEASVSTPEPPKQKSYFNDNKINRVALDDGISYIEHKLIDEGVFQAFQDLTSVVKLDGVNQSTEVDLALGKSRKFLLENLVVGWNLVDSGGNSIPFTYPKLMGLPPEIIAKVVDDIYVKNPVLNNDSDTESGKES